MIPDGFYLLNDPHAYGWEPVRVVSGTFTRCGRKHIERCSDYLSSDYQWRRVDPLVDGQGEVRKEEGPVSDPEPKQPVKRLLKRQKRVKRAIEFLKDYYARYDQQFDYLDYSDHTLIDDALYGIGVALEPDKYRFADGYAKFKAILRKHLESSDDTIPPRG